MSLRGCALPLAGPVKAQRTTTRSQGKNVNSTARMRCRGGGLSRLRASRTALPHNEQGWRGWRGQMDASGQMRQPHVLPSGERTDQQAHLGPDQTRMPGTRPQYADGGPQFRMTPAHLGLVAAVSPGTIGQSFCTVNSVYHSRSFTIAGIWSKQ